MGQMVYVLMQLEGGGKVKEWRPVAVVTDLTIAEQWQQAGQLGKDVDWVPLELDDIKQVYPEKGPRFQPGKIPPMEERAVETARRMQETNRRLVETIKALQKRLGIKEEIPKEITGGFKSPLLKEADRTILPAQPMPRGKSQYEYQPTTTMPIAEDPKKQVPSWVTGAAEDKMPPKPMEGGQPFAETLDAQGLADFIETYAPYEVDNEFVYEKFRGSHAVLKLLPIADLKEGGRDHNLQDPKAEAKYLKQNLKTQPPAVVENGIVLDGNHRLRANKQRGLTHMWCYVVMEGDYADHDDASGDQES